MSSLADTAQKFIEFMNGYNHQEYAHELYICENNSSDTIVLIKANNTRVFTLEKMLMNKDSYKYRAHFLVTGFPAITEVLLGVTNKNDLLFSHMAVKRIDYLVELVKNFKSSLGDDIYDIVKHARLDTLDFEINEDGDFKINFCYALYSSYRSSVYFDIVFDKELNLIKSFFRDPVDSYYKKLCSKNFLQAFKFVLNYSTLTQVRDEIDIEQVTQDNLSDFNSLIDMMNV